jgi:hypothetical protein
MAAALLLIGLSVVAGLMFELHERRAERLERLNHESWELLRASRRIHDETAEALQSMFDEARSKARVTRAREIQE